MKLPKTCLWMVLLVAAIGAAVANGAQVNDPQPKSYYLIGNSLTWDTVPANLSGDVQWHVDCGVNLPHVYANPGKPCVKTSTLWPQALAEKQYDVVSVQPHYGSTLAQDVETISAWMKLQPRATIVVHSGWAWHAKRAEEFDSFSAPTQMVHSPAYVRELIAELNRLHPGRTIRTTLAQNLLAKVAEDIAAKHAPLEKVEVLYRDDIHLTHDAGKYLVHNAMRRAMGQPASGVGFEKIDPKVKAYLDGVLAELDTTAADRALLTKILALDASESRPGLIAKLSDKDLQSRLAALLPTIEQACAVRRSTLALEADVAKVGGKLHCTPTGPQWLYLATGDTGMEIFDVPAAIDCYNGNNPLKGKGGRNELVTDAWLARLVDLPTLRKLDLANCEVHGSGLAHIGKLTSLRELNLTLTPVADEALKHLGELTEMRTLGLASTQCTGTGFAYLKGLTKLENVNLHFTPVNDAGLEAISQLPLSGRLWFAHTHFTDAGAAHLAALKQLKRCGIGSMEKASSGEAIAALVKLPLEDLSLLDNQATPAGVAHAAKIATLKRLDLSHAPTVGDESLQLLAGMPALEELKIGSAQATDAGLQSLAEAKKLKKLSLSGMKKLTPEGIDRLQKARPELAIEVK